MAQNQNDPRQDIVDSLAFYHPPGSTFEIRLKGVKKNKSDLWDNQWTSGNVSGYFNDIEAAADIIIQAEQEVQPELIMTSINNCPADYLARAKNRFRVECPALTNSDIQYIDTVLIDFDPKRPKGMMATNAEKAKAFDKVQEFVEHATAGGLPTPIINDSGNGYHVSFKIPEIDVSEGEELVRDFTEYVAVHYSDENVKVDTSVTAPAHQVRVIGTLNRKGEDMPERPHRRSSIVALPDTLQPIPKDRLVAIAGTKTPAISKPDNKAILPSITAGSLNGARFNLKGYLEHYSVNITKSIIDGDATLYALTECLFDSSHGKNEAVIGQREDGTVIYHCFHDSCQNKQWLDAQKVISGSDSLQPFIEGGNVDFEPMAGSVVSMEELYNIDFPVVPPLVKDIIYRGGATVISGPGGVGKSLLTLNMALALGSPGVSTFLHLTVASQSGTLILQTENSAVDTKDRLQLMANYPGFRAGFKNVYSCTSNLNDIRVLNGDLTRDSFLNRIFQDIQSTGAGLLVIDPLISVNPGDENDNSHMRRMLERLTLLMSVTGIAVVIVHHVGRTVSSGASYAGRGASAVGDWVHNSFLLKPDHKSGTLELSCQKARNSKKPDPIQMKLNQNLVFERVHQAGNFNGVYNQRIVTDALLGIGGIANKQKELVDAIIANAPDINKTKAHEIIKDVVAEGVIIEGQKGRSKTYEFPASPQPTINPPASDIALTTQ